MRDGEQSELRKRKESDVSLLHNFCCCQTNSTYQTMARRVYNNANYECGSYVNSNLLYFFLLFMHLLNQPEKYNEMQEKNKNCCHEIKKRTANIHVMNGQNFS